MRLSRLPLAALAASLLLASCGKESTTPTATVATIHVTPGVDSVGTLGRTVTFTGQPVDAAGAPVSATLVWRSSNPVVATVDSVTGVATALSNGTAVISAHAGGVAGQATMAVSQVVARVTVSPPSAGFTAVGDTQRLAAVAKDSSGALIGGVAFLWGSADPTVARVDTGGLVTSRGPGQVTISATGRGIPGYADVSVTQAPMSLAFRFPPTDALAGDAINPAIQVEVRDSSGNLVTGNRSTIFLSFGTNPGGAILHGSTTVGAVNGVATFSGITIEAASSGYTIVASASGINSVESAGFAITNAAPAALRFVATDTSDTAGQALPFAVRSVDRFGNPAPVVGSVFARFVSNPTAAGLINGNLAPSFSGATADLGVMSIEKAGSGYVLVATGSGGAAGLDSGFSPAFTVKPASPAALALSQQPHTTFLGELFVPTKVSAQDQFGNTTSLSETVTVGLGVNPWGATLSGPLVHSGGGLLTFDSLSVNKPGLGYSLVLTAPGLTPATASPIDVEMFQPVGQAAGDAHTCALVSGLAVCWGDNTFGQLGRAGGEDSVAALVSGGQSFAALTAGGRHTCALDAGGAAYCWGDNSSGQLGNAGAGSGSGVPVSVGGGHLFLQLSAGGSHTCGVATDHTLYCWGEDGAGQLGDSGKAGTTSAPTAVYGGRQYRVVSAGQKHTCAIATDSTAVCFGDDSFGQLGDGSATTGGSDTAVVVQGGLKLRAIAAGASHSCAVTTGSAAYCWGRNNHGQLGNHNLGVDSDVPVAVSTGAIFTSGGALTAGGDHSCGQFNGTDIVCWGSNASGELGTGTAPTDSDQPIRLPVAYFTSGVTAGASHTCATIGSLTTNQLNCWGGNSTGQVGDGTTLDRATSVLVVVQP